ncbi:MAG: hypothetical protein ACR2QV_03490 [Gammaproteobacteria bacterium]
MPKVLVLALIAMSLISAAEAAPVTWTLQNVVFKSGGTATGSFVYDVDTSTYSSISITTSPFMLLGTTYTEIAENPLSDASFLLSHRFDVRQPGDLMVFFLDFESDLTNAGGTVGLSTSVATEAYCFDASVLPCLTETGRIIDPIANASVFALVPIPAAAWLFGSALGLLGWARCKKA